MQNRYNLTDRRSEAVLNYAEANGIGFIPRAPICAGELAQPGGPLVEAAKRLGATTSQVALAWLLRHSPVMMPIPAPVRSNTSKRTWPRPELSGGEAIVRPGGHGTMTNLYRDAAAPFSPTRRNWAAAPAPNPQWFVEDALNGARCSRTPPSGPRMWCATAI